MEVFTSDKNHSVLKSLIEKAINDKLSINIYNTINENVVKNYIKKKIRIIQHNIKEPDDIIKYNKNIIIDFIDDFTKLNKKQEIKNSYKMQEKQEIQETHLTSINVKNEQEKPEDFNEKLKRLQSERDIINDTEEDNNNFSYDNLESFSSNNLQLNNLQQFSSDYNQFDKLDSLSIDSSDFNNNIINKIININKTSTDNQNELIDTQIDKSTQQQLHQSQKSQEQLLHKQQLLQQQLHSSKKSQEQLLNQPQQLQQQQSQQFEQSKQLTQQSAQPKLLDKKNIIINSRDRDWRNNIDRFKYDIAVKKKDMKTVNIPVYENSQIIPNKNFELENSSGWIDHNGMSHKKYDKTLDYGSVLYEYEKIIDTERNIYLLEMNNISKITIEKIIIHKDDVNLPNTFIYLNIPQINNSKLMFIKEKEIDNYIYYSNKSIINILYNIEKYTFELFNYDNSYIGSKNKDFYKISEINYENNMMNITINGNIPSHYINSHFISFNNLNTDDIKVDIFCKKISTMYHKIVGISDNIILIHFADNDIQLFNKEISGYILIETLQNIIFLEVE